MHDFGLELDGDPCRQCLALLLACCAREAPAEVNVLLAQPDLWRCGNG